MFFLQFCSDFLYSHSGEEVAKYSLNNFRFFLLYNEYPFLIQIVSIRRL